MPRKAFLATTLIATCLVLPLALPAQAAFVGVWPTSWAGTEVGAGAVVGASAVLTPNWIWTIHVTALAVDFDACDECVAAYNAGDAPWLFDALFLDLEHSVDPCVHDPGAVALKPAFHQAFKAQAEVESFTMTKEFCADGAMTKTFKFTLPSYALDLPGVGNFNVPDVADFFSHWDCEDRDTEFGYGGNKHDAALAGILTTLVLQAYLTVEAFIFDEPGRCSPDGIEEDLLTGTAVGTVLGVVPVCGSSEASPLTVGANVGPAGAGAHIGWEIHVDLSVLCDDVNSILRLSGQGDFLGV